MESGKLFIGGISWDTNEERLKDYFRKFGEVAEAVVMKNRATGRARGFGFVIFSDPAIADRVVLDRHVIDGRTVEAKKAVPRDDQNTLNRNNTNICGSPGPSHTKKIFVGGLASTVTENDFKKYFDQFGTITDVVVMYDYNTQRPRGFGFITYDSEEAVVNVLCKTFHELNGKMVEVKKAVPKELSPGTGRSSLGAYNYGLSRINSFSNDYTQGFNPGSAGGYRQRKESRYDLILKEEICSSFGPDFRMGLDFGTDFSPDYGETVNHRNSSYIRISNGNINANPTRYSIGNSSLLSFSAPNFCGNGNHDYLSNSSYLRPLAGSGSINAKMGSLSGFGISWDSSKSSHGGTAGSSYGFENLNNGVANKDFTSFGVDIEGNDATSIALEPSYEGVFSHCDPNWHLSMSELGRSGPYINQLGNAASVVMSRNYAGYVGNYGIANRQSEREIAT